MATIQNAADIVLQATTPRLLSSPLNYINVIATTNTITSVSGVLTPSTVTVKATLNGALQGTIAWVLSPSVTYTPITDGIVITSTDISDGVSVLITASLTYAGNVYSANTTVTRKQGIQLSSTGVLTGEGGGSITNLDYTNVGGTKPPANATSNFFTTSTSDPTGGSDGDAHYNSSTNVMWFKVSGTWQQGGTINASQITVGTLAAARIAANSITADKLNVTSLSAVSANLGSVTAGSITGTSTIDIAGSARFAGSTTDGGSLYTVVCDAASISFGGGLKGNAGSGGVGVYGDTGTVGDRGVAGVSRVYGSRGVQAINTAGGWALDVSGYMTINNTTLVSNLNSDLLDGYHAASFCSVVPCNTGTCTVSGQGFNLSTTIAGYQFRGTGNFIYLEATSDRKLKQDIVDEVYGLDFINKLRPVQYRLKSRPESKYHGFIAQEVESLISSTDDVLAKINSDGTKGVDYIALISPIVKALQDLSKIQDEILIKISKIKIDK